MEGIPRRQEDADEDKPLDSFASNGRARRNDWPGADLYDQIGDLTNITESADTTGLNGPKDRVHHHGRGLGEYAGGGLSIVKGDEVLNEEEDDPAAEWLRENDPDLGNEGGDIDRAA